MTTKILTIVILALCGCGGAAPADPVNGIYRVTVKTTADSCQPARLIGEVGDTTIAVAAAGMNVGVPEQSGMAWKIFELPASAGYAMQNDVTGSCGSQHLALQRLASTADSVEVSAIQDWTVSAVCASDGVPVASCHAEQVLSYALRMTCRVPMIIYGAPDGSITCAQ